MDGVRRTVDIRTLKFRRMIGAEDYRCHAKNCGKVADYVAFVEVDVPDNVGVVAFCEECAKKRKRRSPQSFLDESENNNKTP